MFHTSGKTGSPGARLQAAFAAPGLCLVGSVQDALTARLAETAGFQAAVLGGATVTNSLLGLPDAGFVTLTEMEFVTARATAATQMPVIVDADNGYGNAINVVRTITALERAGAAGVFFEDQESPPRGASSGILLVSAEEMAGKVRAAVDARADGEFVVIARSDARRVEGLRAVIERGKRYADAGADAFFAAGVRALDELEVVVREVPVAHHVGILGADPEVTPLALAERGYACAVSGTGPLRLGAAAVLRAYTSLVKGDGADTVQGLAGSALEDWDRYTGFEVLRSMEERYLPTSALDDRYA